MPKILCEWNNCYYNSARHGTIYRLGDCQYKDLIHLNLDKVHGKYLECANYKDSSEMEEKEK